MSNSQFKNNLCEKGKVDTRTPRDSRNGGGGGGGGEEDINL